MTELISIETLSKILDIPKGTLRQMCHKRQIPFVKFPNRMVRFDTKEVEKYIKDRTIRAKAIGE